MASNAEKHRLIRQAQQRAQQLGGLIQLLLSGQQADIGWDKRLQLFTVSNKIIGVTVIRQELNRLDGQLVSIIRAYLNNLSSGLWTIERWREEMIRLLEDSHSIFAALAVGGLATALLGFPLVISQIERDEVYLRAFSRDITANRQPINRRAELRGASYIRSAYVTYSVLDLRSHIEAGFMEAINVTRALESCHSGGGETGCLNLSGRGWIPVEEMVPIGSRRCRQWCRCYIAYRR